MSNTIDQLNGRKPASKLAPVAMFAYARVEHLISSINSLLTNPEVVNTDLIVFCDAAKTKVHESNCQAVRNFVKSIQGFRSLTIIERDWNFGLAQNIIDGVTSVVNKFGRVIVLEDDMIVSKHFLKFMNHALDMYADDDRVISVHGYVYPVGSVLPESFFLRGADCWGWATWKRGWSYFNHDGEYLLNQLKLQRLTHQFDYEGTYPFTKMLINQINGKNDSWAIRWYASAFLANKLTLYPGHSMVHNIGNDASGTHCLESTVYDVKLADNPINLLNCKVAPSSIAYYAFRDYFKSIKDGFFKRALNYIRRIFMRNYG